MGMRMDDRHGTRVNNQDIIKSIGILLKDQEEAIYAKLHVELQTQSEEIKRSFRTELRPLQNGFDRFRLDELSKYAYDPDARVTKNELTHAADVKNDLLILWKDNMYRQATFSRAFMNRYQIPVTQFAYGDLHIPTQALGAVNIRSNLQWLDTWQTCSISFINLPFERQRQFLEFKDGLRRICDRVIGAWITSTEEEIPFPDPETQETYEDLVTSYNQYQLD
ncbi:hypothetical protein BGW36DRAFT_358624 [Talaromyces proteolyticus]|uniref:Uncharacterized protein n=1 Tax=Talaromyces proteolyticus TaxID=1131652 RepID=A0AAD4PZK3_9EURO|nr:uncharacterized protein BGW36DRAFT_358624 [Talaromyces proteolyticus]KAH8699116.1 hypothetical protein BGW36DRAFT_358624 [Talaromyces proteolyticus]